MMADRVTKGKVIILCLMLVTVVFVWWPEFDEVKFRTPTCDPALLCVVFLDVGQGDSIFIQSPNGNQILIDGGRGSAVLRELSSVMNFADRDIDYVLMTHPDADHIAGLVPVFDRYDVETVIRTENESDTAIWQTLEARIEEEGSGVYLARRGQRYVFGEVYLDILFPDTDPIEMESNTSSIVARLVYGNTSFMLTGDAPKSIEEYLVLIEGENLKSDVLKVGHHGSRTSTSEIFLAEVDPQYAIISAGEDNTYGHPHVEVTDLLFNYGVKAVNTANNGRIVFWSDGTSLEMR